MWHASKQMPSEAHDCDIIYQCVACCTSAAQQVPDSQSRLPAEHSLREFCWCHSRFHR